MSKHNYLISIVIRTYNEQKHIGELLESLTNQNYKRFEVIIVDSESTDDTLDIIKKYKNILSIKIIEIRKMDFDYSYASNIGVAKSKGDVVCFLSGHSVPNSEEYLSVVNDSFQDKKVGGVYGDTIANYDGSISEKIYNRLGIIKNSILNKNPLEDNIHPGILSCSNAAIRKSVFSKHKFAKELGKTGGEDVEMAYRILKDGDQILYNAAMTVKHSHGKKMPAFIKELKNWKKIYERVIIYLRENP